METRCKYPEWTRGQVEALLNIIGEENARKLLVGEISVELRETMEKFFDKNDRRIPKGLLDSVCDANKDFRLSQPKMEIVADYEVYLRRLHECLGDTGITPEQLKRESEKLWAEIQENPQIANITNGVGLPVVLPKLTTSDLGTALEQYLEAVGGSYSKTFSGRSFNNYRKGELSGNVSIVAGSKHDQLISRMKEGPVIGIHFPNPLQGFSINASREQMSTLPEGFVLSGMDTAIAMAMYPDILACDWKTPGLDLAALQWQSAGYSLYFRAGDDRLGFDRTDDLTYAGGYYSGGLLFLG